MKNIGKVIFPLILFLSACSVIQPEVALTLPAPLSLDDPPPLQQPSEQKGCGDGVCDGPENAQNCPQDCGEVPPTGSEILPSTGSPAYEPPINVSLILHIDPDMAGEQYTFTATPDIYQKTKGGIDWFIEEAKSHNLKFSSLYNGWYPMEALELNDLSQFQTLVDAGHEIGTHAHRITYDPATDVWTAHIEELSFYGRPNYDPILAQQVWDDATKSLEDVLQRLGITGQNQIVATRTFTFANEELLMEQYGFPISAGNRAELSSDYFGHMVWNPWRPAGNDEPGHDIEEDITRSFITIDHLAQIGSHEISHAMDLSIPQMQRRFIMLYTEWLSRVRKGVEDKVWTFNFVYHPNYEDKYYRETTEFLNWLDEFFIGKTTSEGYTIARYATLREIAQEFTAWEADHPGTSSFNYVRDDPYPYTYPMLPTMLEDAAYEAMVDLGPGVTCFRFSKNGNVIYLLWSDQGQRTVNLLELKGQVRITNSKGEESISDAANIALTEEPLFVEPVQ